MALTPGTRLGSYDDSQPTNSPADDRSAMTSVTSVVLVALLAAAFPAQSQTAARLFDGRSLTGWEGDSAVWRVVDSAVVGGSLEKPIRQDEFLCTTAEFDNFELRVSARLKGTGQNAGVSFRAQRVPGSNQVGGYQADIGFTAGRTIARLSNTVPNDLERPYPLWGSLLDEYRPEAFRYPNPAQPYRLIAVAARDIVERTLRPNDWNEIVVFAVGPRIRLQLNGTTTVEFVEKERVPVGGKLCLQTHNGSPLEAWFRSLTIRPIAPSIR
jgi:3-keto-disaccharide hydrolase